MAKAKIKKTWFESIHDSEKREYDFMYYSHLSRITGDARLGVILSYIIHNGWWCDGIDGGIEYEDGCLGLPYIDFKHGIEALTAMCLLVKQDPEGCPEDLKGTVLMINQKELKKAYSDTYTDYHKYLKSRAWEAQRLVALMKANYRCQQCNSPQNLNVHHNTYDHLGHEFPSDLTVLCYNCHAKVHGKEAKK